MQRFGVVMTVTVRNYHLRGAGVVELRADPMIHWLLSKWVITPVINGITTK